MAGKHDKQMTMIDKIEQINQLLNEVKNSVYQSQSAQHTNVIDDPKSLGQILDKRRKELGVSLHLLQLQTGVSAATLNRLFKNAEQIKFATVLSVASTLGVKLCIAE